MSKPRIHTYHMPEPLGGDWAVSIDGITTDDPLLGTGIGKYGFKTEEKAREWAENKLEDMKGESDE